MDRSGPAGTLRRGPSAGTTLMEVMIAVSILGILLLVFMSIMFSSHSLSASTRESAIAAYDLQSALEDTFGVPYDNFLTLYPTNYVFPGTLYNRLKNESLVLTRLATGASDDWVEYRIEITYKNHRGRAVSDRIVTRRSR